MAARIVWDPDLWVFEIHPKLIKADKEFDRE